MRSASARIVHQPPQRAGERIGVGSQTKPFTPSSTSSAGPPLSRQVTTALRDAKASAVTKP